MTHPLIILFDFDGVVITQKALEFTALKYLKKTFYNWKNAESLRLIDFARLFEEADSSNKLKAFFNAFRVYRNYIPSRWKRFLFFVKFRRTYPKYEKYETLKPNLEGILRDLKKCGVICGIVSNTSTERLELFRKRLNLDDFFSVIRDISEFPVNFKIGGDITRKIYSVARGHASA